MHHMEGKEGNPCFDRVFVIPFTAECQNDLAERLKSNERKYDLLERELSRSEILPALLASMLGRNIAVRC